ncbi:MAG: chemotaxis protein CheW [Candidatus Acidiferrum sp.]
MSDSIQYCTFFLGEFLFGLEVGQVREVLRAQRITRVPLAPAMFSGLINLRGQIITAVDLRQRLQLNTARSVSGSVNVIVQVNKGTVSFLVDGMSEVVDVERRALEPLPETLRGVARQLVKGVHKLPKQLLLILFPERVLDLQIV